MATQRKSALVGVKRVVVKIGTSLSWDPKRGIDPRNLKALVAEIAGLRRKGLQVVIVASGAIGAGMYRLKLAERPKDVRYKQATAAVGQVYLMELVASVFERYGLNTGQVLISRQDLESGPRYFNARNTLETLLTMGVVPVINENDTVAVDEIKFGDNDRLAALITNLVQAQLLVVLTDVDGLHDADPRQDKGAKRVSLVKGITAKLEAAAGGQGSVAGTGGMVTKLLAARMATGNGEHVVIANGVRRGVLGKVLAGADIGTLFLATQPQGSRGLRWMPFSDGKRSELVVKRSAEARVKRTRSHLYPADIQAVRGDFHAGDAVRLSDETGRTWAKAVCRLSAQDCARLKGKELWQVEKLAGRLPNQELVAFEDIAFKQEF